MVVRDVLHGKRPCHGDGVELLGWSVDLSHKVLAHRTRSHDLSRVGGDRRPVKILLESLSNHTL
jgi:hypothetical protein